jgi:hypothetical protein
MYHKLDSWDSLRLCIIAMKQAEGVPCFVCPKRVEFFSSLREVRFLHTVDRTQNDFLCFRQVHCSHTV